MNTPILGGYAVARSVNAADNRLMNLYPEATPEGGKTAGFLTRCPGYKFVADVGSGPIRGLWTFGGFLYVVSGVELYKVNADWAATLLGTVSGSGPVSMSDNGEQLFVACNPRSYTYSVASNLFAEITDPDFPGAVTVGFINGYFVFNEPDSQKVWITSYQDGASVDPLEFSYTDANPDNLLSLVVNRNEIWMFGTTSTEVWYYSGDIDFPLARIQGAFNEIGCAAPYSVAKLDNTVFWLGSDPRGNAMVYKAAGYGAQRVSTHGIEKVLQGYQYVGDAIGYSYQQEGHTFYVLTFPSANATWVFDAATNEWHERGSWKQGHYNRHRSNCQANFSNTIVLGDFQYGKLYEFDLEYYKDDVGTQRWVRSWRALPPNANNLNRTAHHSLQVELETGTRTIEATTTSPVPPSSSITLDYNARWSVNHSDHSLVIDNNGHDVSNANGPAIPSYLTAMAVKTWPSGNYYFELTYTLKDPSSVLYVGVGPATYNFNEFIGQSAGVNSVGYRADSAGTAANDVLNATAIVDNLSAYGDAAQGDVLMVAVQGGSLAAWASGSPMGGKVWFGRNGTWFNGNPSALTGGATLGVLYYADTPLMGAFVTLIGSSTTQKITANFGDSAFAHTVPTGFNAWSNANPSVYGSLNTNLYATGLNVSASSVTNNIGPVFDAFACSGYSQTSGKVYFEASGFIESAFPSESLIALGEGGMLFYSEPAGQGIYSLYEQHEGCCINFCQLSTVPYVALPNLAYGQKFNAGSSSYVSSTSAISGPTQCKTGDRLMVAIDFDAGKAWFGSKGQWSGNPETGTGQAWTFTPNNEMYVYAGINDPIFGNPGASTTVYFNPSQFAHPIPAGYTVFNSSGVTTATSERIPKVLLRWSDDGGHTWSNYYDREMGALGEYWTRVIWRRLGMATKLRDRVYELSGSDPVKITITGAELVLSGTNS
jgi:hypothetical protein